MRALITGGGGQLASDLAELLGDAASCLHARASSTSPTATRSTARSPRSQPDIVFNCAAFHNVDVCETRADTRVGGQRRGGARAGATRARGWSTSRPTTCSTDGEQSPTARLTCHPALDLRADQAGRASTPRSPTADVRSWCAPRGLYGLHGSASKGGNFVQRMIARAREQGALAMVADQRLQPTFTADLAAALLAAVRRPAPTASCTSPRRARARGTSSRRRSWSAPGSMCRSSRSRRCIPPAASTGR